MSLKTFLFCLLPLLIMRLSEVKSDLPKERRSSNPLAQFMEDPNFRNNIITFLETPEERAAQQNNQISQLGVSVDQLIEHIRRAREQIAMMSISAEQSLKDRVEQSRFERAINEVLNYIIQLRTTHREHLTEAERSEHRNTLIHRFQEFINHLNRTLYLYAHEISLRELRVKELSFFVRIEENLNVYKQLDLSKRLIEVRATMPQAMRDSLAKDLSLKDELERTIRTGIETLRKRHERDRPIDDEHKKEVMLLNDHWKNFSSLVDRIEKQRKQLQIFFQEQQNRAAQERTASQEQTVQIKRTQEQNLQEQQNAKRYKQGPAGEGPSGYTGPKQGPGGQSRKY